MKKNKERKWIFCGMHDDWVACVVVLGKRRSPLVLLTSYTCQQLFQALCLVIEEFWSLAGYTHIPCFSLQASVTIARMYLMRCSTNQCFPGSDLLPQRTPAHHYKTGRFFKYPSAEHVTKNNLDFWLFISIKACLLIKQNHFRYDFTIT